MSLASSSRLASSFTSPIAAAVAVASLGGLLVPGLYARETASWRIEAHAQDLFDLFCLVPALVVAAWAARRGSRAALAAWLGAVGVTLYTFVLYTFAVHFNAFFLVYCAALGLSVYGLGLVVARLGSGPFAAGVAPDTLRTPAAAYLALLAVMFGALWIGDIAGALARGDVPTNVRANGLLTNPVHVLDLSIVLPAFGMTAYGLIRRYAWAWVAAPAMLSFSVLMAASIGFMAGLSAWEGAAGAWPVAVGMGVNSLIALMLFAAMARGLGRWTVDDEEGREAT